MVKEMLSEKEKKFIQKINRPMYKSYWQLIVIIPFLPFFPNVPPFYRKISYVLLIFLVILILCTNIYDSRMFSKIIKKISPKE